MFLKRRGKFDMVMAWSVDRLGRSLQDLVHFLSELHALHVDLFLHQEGLDSTVSHGRRQSLCAQRHSAKAPYVAEGR